MTTNTATTYTTSISTTGTNSNNICFDNTTTTDITGELIMSNTTMYPTVVKKMVSFLELEEDFNKKKEPEVDPETKSTITKNQRNNLVANFYEDGFKKNCKELIPDIKDVTVHQNRIVIVEFVDGTTEKAVLHPSDQFSVEQGISICITKRLVGGSSIYNKLIDRAVKVMINNDAERTKKAKAEDERKEYNKRRNERKARRKSERREEQIELQKEAYVRALRELGIGG